MRERWVAVDFETATGDRASACAVAAVEVLDGEVASSRLWLIRPPGNRYDPWNSSIHGFQPHHTTNSPAFPEVWSEIEAFIGGAPVVAHYSGFDLSVLRAEAVAMPAPPRGLAYVCTVVFGRRHWPELPSYSLPWVCDAIGVSLAAHHDPMSDAAACARIGLKILDDLGVRSWSEAAERLNVKLGFFDPARSIDRRCEGRFNRSVPAPNPDAPTDHPLFGKNILFTGTLSRWSRSEARAEAARVGAVCTTTVNQSTDYLVLGVQNPRQLRPGMSVSTKMEKAMALNRRGFPVELISEIDFERLLV